MKLASRVLLVLMGVLALVHLVAFVRDRHAYDLVATGGFALLAYGNLRMGQTPVDQHGQYIGTDRRGQRLGFVGAALVMVYFIMKYSQALAG